MTTGRAPAARRARPVAARAHARDAAAAAPAHEDLAAAAIDAADPAVRVLRQFRIVFNAVKSHLLQVERRAGVTGAQLWALHAIDRAPGLGVVHLARAMDVRQPTASLLVRSLVDKGLVDARRDDVDRRALRLHLQPGGRALLRDNPGPFEGVLPDALRALDRQTLQALEQPLATLIRQLDADDRQRHIPLAVD